MTITSPGPIRFGNLTIHHDDGLLRPRPWTVAQSEWAARIMSGLPPGPMVEFCTGAGQIGLLALARSGRSGVLVDVDPVACACARRNAEHAGLQDRVEVRNAHVLEALRDHEEFVCAVIDPPWVPSAALREFPLDPQLAIDGGIDGLVTARMCLTAIDRNLAAEGAVVLQVGDPGQIAVIAEWLDRPDSPDLELVRVRLVRGSGVLAELRRRNRTPEKPGGSH